MWSTQGIQLHHKKFKKCGHSYKEMYIGNISIQMKIPKIFKANKRTHQENTYNIGVASRQYDESRQ